MAAVQGLVLGAPMDDATDVGPGAVDVVVAHHVPEPVRLLELVPCDGDPLADLSRRLGRPLAQRTTLYGRTETVGKRLRPPPEAEFVPVDLPTRTSLA